MWSTTRRCNAWLEWQNVDWMDLPYFKITFDYHEKDLNLKMRVVPAWYFNGRIFESLQWIYIENWMTKPEASAKANQVVTDFYRAASECTKNKVNPFKAYVKSF